MTDAWGDLFDRGRERDVSLPEIRESIERRRADVGGSTSTEGAAGDGTDRDEGDDASDGPVDGGDGPVDGSDGSGKAGDDHREAADAPGAGDGDRPSPARVVADADVIVADLLVGGAARDALDHARRHDWVDLVASDPLLDDVEAAVSALADDDLAAAHRERLAAERVPVDHPAGDHPALASAYRGGAAHVLTFDDGLTSATANLSLKPRVDVSVRTPDAFARLFDPERLYGAVEPGEYPGPDRDPRA